MHQWDELPKTGGTVDHGQQPQAKLSQEFAIMNR